jgi:uncharacterized protein
LYLSVRDLELRKLFFDVAFRPGEIDFEAEDVKQVSALETAGSAELLANTLGEIRIRGHLKVMMETGCDRCLELCRFPIESDFDLFYRPPGEDGESGDEVALSEGESEIGFYDGDGLELEEVLREFVLLTLPMQRVCGPECLGICPACGQNRNQAACGCKPVAGDDRWAALKDFKAPHGGN